MQHPWLLPFIHPLAAAASTGAGTPTPTIQLSLPPPPQPPLHHAHHHHPHHIHPHHHHHLAGLSIQPMLSAPSGALLLPALQQNAAAAVAAFAAAAAAAAAAATQHQQHQPAPGSVAAAAFSMAGSPVMMAPFQQRARLKVSVFTFASLDANKCRPEVVASVFFFLSLFHFLFVVVDPPSVILASSISFSHSR